MSRQQDHDPVFQPQAEGAVTDSVCGMTVDPVRTAHHAAHDGHEFHFCSAGCRAKFLADPAKSLNPDLPEQATSGVIYTCPMHPEVRQLDGMSSSSSMIRPDRQPRRSSSSVSRSSISASV